MEKQSPKQGQTAFAVVTTDLKALPKQLLQNILLSPLSLDPAVKNNNVFHPL